MQKELEKRFPRLLSPEDVATVFNLSVETLSRYRSEGKGPPFYKIESNVRYLESEVISYLDSGRTDPRADQ